MRLHRNMCALCDLPIVSYAGFTWQGTLDHIVPLAKGGPHHEGNIQLAHFMCNVIKGDERPRWQKRMWSRIRTDSPFAHWCGPRARCG